MKKILLIIFAFAFCLTLSGCNKTTIEEGEKPTKIDNKTNVNAGMVSDEIKNMFDAANQKYDKENLQLVASLGEQVVAGTNYMFLCKSGDDFKVVILYKDLEGNTEITKVTDFNLKKYINKNISVEKEDLSGGWYTVISGRPPKIDGVVDAYFNKATEELEGVEYIPVSLLTTQNVNDGTLYAIFAYGRVTSEVKVDSPYILTLHVDEEGKSTIASIAEIDLKGFN